MAELLAIVLVPGAFHHTSQYAQLQNILESAGYQTTTVDLPSTGGPRPLGNALPDFEAVRNVCKNYIDNGLDVILAMHSYGGVAGSGGAKGLRPQETSNGKGIIALAYYAAFALDEGSSLVDAFGNGHAPWARLHKNIGSAGWLYPNNTSFEPGTLFYNDCSKEVQDEHVSKLRVWSEAAAHTKMPYAVWKEIESSYLVCTLDNACPAQPVQEMFAEKIRAVSGRVEYMEASHSPFLSKPAALATFIRGCHKPKIVDI